MTSHPTDADTLTCLLKLTFDNDRSRYDRFYEIGQATARDPHVGSTTRSSLKRSRAIYSAARS